MAGEAKKRESIEGSLTKRQLVTLGMLAIKFGKTDPKQGGAGDGQRGARDKKRKAQAQFGIAWVEEQVEERTSDPTFEGKRLFEKNQMTAEEVRVEVDRDTLAWVIDELDKVPAGSAEDTIIGRIEDRLMDMKRGTYAMPVSLLAEVPPAPANGVVHDIEAAPAPQS